MNHLDGPGLHPPALLRATSIDTLTHPAQPRSIAHLRLERYHLGQRLIRLREILQAVHFSLREKSAVCTTALQLASNMILSIETGSAVSSE